MIPLLWTVFLSALSALPAHAASDVAVNFRCVTSSPTTSFVVETKEAKVLLTVVHHNGVPYMPIHRGIIVPADLPLLARKAEVMQKAGDRFEIEFERRNCQNYGKDLYSCGQGKVLANGLPSAVRGSLLTKTAVERLYDVEFAKNTVSAGFSVDGEYYSIENDFYFEDCKFF